MAISKTKQLELLTARLLNLDPNITIKKIKLTPYGEVVYPEIPLPKIRVCTKCGSNNCNIDAWEEHTFKHFPINNRKIFLHVDNTPIAATYSMHGAMAVQMVPVKVLTTR